MMSMTEVTYIYNIYGHDNVNEKSSHTYKYLVLWQLERWMLIGVFIRTVTVVETSDVYVHCATHRARLSSSTFLTGQATNLSVSSVVVGSHSNIILLLSQANDVLLASQNRWKKENY